MKKIFLIIAVALFAMPFVSHATRVEIPGYKLVTQVPETGPSGTVTIKVTCALVSESVCLVIQTGPVVPPVIPPLDLPTYYPTLHNTSLTIFQPDGVTPMYTGSLNTINVTPVVYGGSSANEIEFNFNPAP